MAKKKTLTLGETIKRTVDQIVGEGEPAEAVEQAQRVQELAHYLGEQGVDLYAELTGVKDADEIFLQGVAAEKAESEGWDWGELVAFLAVAAQMAVSIMGLGPTAELVAQMVKSAVTPNGDEPSILAANFAALVDDSGVADMVEEWKASRG